jgi:hypothetical protein
VELRTYRLPNGYAERVVGTLNRAFERGQEAVDVARATAGPGGTVVVVAPRTVLAGVDQLVADVASVPADTPRNVQLEYWLVRGEPGALDVPPELRAVAPVLEAVAEADGPQRFSLVATRRLTSLDGDSAEISDDVLHKLRQVASVEPGAAAIVADVTIEVRRGAEIRSRLVVAPGKTVVLAQAGGPTADEAPSSLYALVRPTIP